MQQIPAFYFNPQYLRELAEKYRDEYRTNKPYQHIIIDDFLPIEIIDLIRSEFPKPYDIQWDMAGPGICKPILDKPYLNKLSKSDENFFGPFTRHLMAHFNSSTFIYFLEALVGVSNIIPDHTFSGCGMHSTGHGGRLMIHIDQSRHPDQRLDQMINMILFLNKDWKEEYGGHFELWDAKATQCVKKVSPIYNRLVIFNTGTNTFHGHPHPLECPEDIRRDSLSIYYYVVNRPRGPDYLRRSRMVGWMPQTDEDRQWINEQIAKDPSYATPMSINGDD